jgi:hypothetical protein
LKARVGDRRELLAAEMLGHQSAQDASLPKRTYWETRRRLRQRVVLLRVPVVHYLMRITLCGENPSKVMPPR